MVLVDHQLNTFCTVKENNSTAFLILISSINIADPGPDRLNFRYTDTIPGAASFPEMPEKEMQ